MTLTKLNFSFKPFLSIEVNLISLFRIMALLPPMEFGSQFQNLIQAQRAGAFGHCFICPFSHQICCFSTISVPHMGMWNYFYEISHGHIYIYRWHSFFLPQVLIICPFCCAFNFIFLRLLNLHSIFKNDLFFNYSWCTIITFSFLSVAHFWWFTYY